MSGQPVNHQGADAAPDKIELLGGGLCNLCSGSFCYACWCPACAWGDAAERANEGSCFIQGLLICCVPCYAPICTSKIVDDVNQRLGGQPNAFKRCCCHLCCFPCAVAQFDRAVTNAKSKGLLNQNGAPAQEEMTI